MTRDLVDFGLLKFGRPPLRVCLDGQLFYGYFRHRSFLHHLSTGRYQPMMTDLFKSHLKPGMIVVDGGAHIGFYTLLAARLVGPHGRVFSFEPDNFNFRCLLLNISRNKLRNVVAIQKAIADKTGDANFYEWSSTISSSLANRKDLRGADVRRVEVPSTTLDAEIGNIPVDVIKLNIEGAEAMALRGMSRMLQSDRPVAMFAEVNPPALRELGQTPEAFVGELKQLGFAVHAIDEVNYKLLPLSGNPIRKGNLYCTKADE